MPQARFDINGDQGAAYRMKSLAVRPRPVP